MHQKSITSPFTLHLIILLLLTACGYRFVGRENLSGVSSVAIPVFLNQTLRGGIENIITNAIREEFIRSKRIRLVSEKEAEAILDGAVTSFSETPVSLTPEGLVLEARATVVLSATLKRRSDGQALWSSANISFSEEYRADSDVAVNEKRREEAIRRIAQELAKRVHNGILVKF